MTEKTLIREKLQKYQDDFLNDNQRKIRYHKDILPIEKDYKAYKSIKEELAKVQALLGEGYASVTDANARSSG